MKIGKRLMFSFSVVLLFLLIITVVSIQRINYLSSVSEQFLNEDVKQVSLASEVNIQAQAAAMTLLRILNTSEREQRVPLYKVMDSHNAALKKALETLTNLNSTGSELNQVNQDLISYEKSFTETVEYVEFNREMAFEHFNKNTQPKLNSLLSDINMLLTRQQAQMQSSHKDSVKENQQAKGIVIILSVVALILAGLLAVLVSRSIVIPLRSSVTMAKNIAEGDLTQTKATGRNDEIGELEQAFGLMTQGLSDLIESIKQSANQITGSTDSLTSPVREVKSGSENQQFAVQNIENIVSDFSQNSDQAVEAAKESTEQAEQAMNLANEGKALIDKTTFEFDKIATTISNSAQLVESLRDHARSVSNLVNTVREIAEQTNLLALNAAIEAARAGESGRGFSVVADEVRSLAGRASDATSQIDEVIESIVTGTTTAADRIGEGRSEMDDGVEMLQEMVKPLSDLSDSARISLTQLQGLEETIASQAVKSNQINEEVHKISMMAESNNTSVNTVSSITDSLNELSGNLGNQIKKFRNS